MAKSNFYVGLEIGTSKVCMVVGEVKSDSSTKILCVEETRSVGVRSGEIHDFANVRNCVKTVLTEAEDQSDVEISTVLVSVAGAGIVGVNSYGTYRLPDSEETILEEHIKEASTIAQEIAIPKDHVIIHAVERYFTIDGGEPTHSPLGQSGRTIEASFHIVHGPRGLLQNTVRCVREIPLEVEDVVFAPIAAAQAALSGEQKDSGALVIDIGGGTTSFAYYCKKALTATGCLPIGGDHITNDIHLVTGISLARSESLKVLEGDASAAAATSVGLVKVPDDTGMSNQSVEREVLNGVIRARFEEILELVEKRLPDDFRSNIGAGVFLVGGSSQMNGLGELVQEVFYPHVYRYEVPEMSGHRKFYEDPNYSTAVGLLRYALIVEQDSRKMGFFGRILRFFRSLSPF